MPPTRIYTESYERWFAALAPMYQGDVNCVFEFAGHLDERRLRQAFLTAVAADPMWSYRFVTRRWLPYWRIIPREDRPSLVSVEPCRHDDDRRAAWERLLDSPVDAAVRVIVFRTPHNDHVCFRIDHRLADASGARPLLQAVAGHYATPVEPPARDAPLVRRTAALLRPVASVRSRLALLGENARAAARTAGTRGFAPRLPTADDPYVSPRFLHYPEGATDALAGRALRDRATSVMVIMAATYLGLRDVLDFADGVSWPMTLPVNLRRYLPRGDQAAPASMLSGQVLVWVEPDRAADFDAVLAQIRAQLAAQRGPLFGLALSAVPTDLPVLRHYVFLRPFAWMQQEVAASHQAGARTPPVYVSDQGSFGSPGETWAGVPFEHAYCTQGTWKTSTILVAASSCGSRLTLAVGSGPLSFVDPLTRRIDFHLSQYAGWAPLCAPAELQESTR